ncbi:MAG: gamma-glutamyl-gamma-aminobutyrate hydrolase family protein [Candidatus Nanopelagicales bacterium]
MTRRPLIAVPAMRSARVAGLRREGLVMAERIAECVLRAGGEPLVLAPADGREIAARLASFDGVLVPGGRDVDPAAYGEDARHESTDEPDPVQDAADLALLRAVVETDLPTLAICRGLQLLNVALGGTLVQHLDDPDGLHRNAFHDVSLEPGSRTAAAMRSDRVRVSSYHHQAVERLGLGLRVVGRGDDGVVEALEHTVADVVAVQWHPEDDAHEAPQQQALFDALVERAHRRTRKVRASA